MIVLLRTCQSETVFKILHQQFSLSYLLFFAELCWKLSHNMQRIEILMNVPQATLIISASEAMR